MDPIITHAHILWDYLRLNQALVPADAICVLGSDSTRVAERGAALWHEGYAPYLIVSGGQAHRSPKGQTEAEIYATIARSRGIPNDRIILEPHATNTGENILFIKQTLQQKGYDFHSFILVHKPYMERRVYATFRAVWPDATCMVTSPPIDLDTYTKDTAARDRIVGHLLSTLHRIKTYPQRGFQIHQDIPPEVEAAYAYLVAQGYQPH